MTRTRYLALLLSFILSASVMPQAPAVLGGAWLFVYIAALAGVAVHLLLLTVCSVVWSAVSDADRTHLLTAIDLYRPVAITLCLVSLVFAFWVAA